MPEALNAVIYARYSSDRQTEQSIEGQLRECYAFAKANDIAVIDKHRVGKSILAGSVLQCK